MGGGGEAEVKRRLSKVLREIFTLCIHKTTCGTTTSLSYDRVIEHIII